MAQEQKRCIWLLRHPCEPCRRELAAWLAAHCPVLPVELLLLGDDGLYSFDEAQIRLILLHVAVSARPVHAQALLALHPLRGGAVRRPGLAIAGDALPALN